MVFVSPFVNATQKKRSSNDDVSSVSKKIRWKAAPEEIDLCDSPQPPELTVSAAVPTCKQAATSDPTEEACGLMFDRAITKARKAVSTLVTEQLESPDDASLMEKMTEKRKIVKKMSMAKKSGEFIDHMLDITDNGERILKDPMFSSQDIVDRLEFYYKTDETN